MWVQEGTWSLVSTRVSVRCNPTYDQQLLHFLGCQIKLSLKMDHWRRAETAGGSINTLLDLDPPQLHGRATQAKLLLKHCVMGRNPKARQKEKSITSLTGIIQTTNMSPRLNTHGLIDRTNQSKVYCDNRGNSKDKYITTIKKNQTLIIQSIESIY